MIKRKIDWTFEVCDVIIYWTEGNNRARIFLNSFPNWFSRSCPALLDYGERMTGLLRPTHRIYIQGRVIVCGRHEFSESQGFCSFSALR